MMRLRHNKQKRVSAAELEFVYRVLRSGQFIILDLLVFSIFFSLMSLLFPAAIYLTITTIYVIYMALSYILFLLTKKTGKRHS